MTIPFLKRAAAGIVTAALTGTVAGVVISLYALTGCCPSGPGANQSGDSMMFIAMSTFFGGILGAPFGILVMCLSRAKAAPWDALPRLLFGTSIGIVILGLPWALLPGTTINSTILDVMCIVGPTIGGIVAALFVPEQRPTGLVS